ncbi:hypothetical protein D3C80_2053390 [compost metagenome]
MLKIIHPGPRRVEAHARIIILESDDQPIEGQVTEYECDDDARDQHHMKSFLSSQFGQHAVPPFRADQRRRRQVSPSRAIIPLIIGRRTSR